MNRPLVVRFNRFTLDQGRRLLVHDGRPVHLTRKAFDLLAVLVEQAPNVVTKDDLHHRLWTNTFVSDSTVAGVVKELRRALGEHAGGAPLIRTVHGVGYAFSGIVDPADANAPEPARCWLVSGDRRLHLAEGANDLGRDPGVTVSLDAPEASRRHARITFNGSQAWVEDLGSKNGTFVNDRLVSQPTPLADGDAICIAGIVLVFRVLRPLATTVTAAGERPRGHI